MTTKVLIENRYEQQSDSSADSSSDELMRKYEHLYAAQVEDRLKHLNRRLQNVNAASYLVWLKGGVHRFDPILDLRVKVEAVRWMLRIAKHLKDGARETVFLSVMNSLDQLEKTVESGVSSHEAGVRGATEVIHSRSNSNQVWKS